MKNKKGFALASTMVAMVLVLALSNLLLVLATSTNAYAKTQITKFEKTEQIYQHTQNFVDLNIANFKLLYQNYIEEILDNTIKLSSVKDNFCFEITTTETVETLAVKNYYQTITFATVEKENGIVTSWNIAK